MKRTSITIQYNDFNDGLDRYAGWKELYVRQEFRQNQDHPNAPPLEPSSPTGKTTAMSTTNTATTTQQRRRRRRRHPERQSHRKREARGRRTEVWSLRKILLPRSHPQNPHKPYELRAMEGSRRAHLRLNGDGAALASLGRLIPVCLRPLDGVLGQVDGVQQLPLRTVTPSGCPEHKNVHPERERVVLPLTARRTKKYARKASNLSAPPSSATEIDKNSSLHIRRNKQGGVLPAPLPTPWTLNKPP